MWSQLLTSFGLTLEEALEPILYYQVSSPGGKPFLTSVPIYHWPRSARRRGAGHFSRDGGSWAMGLLS